MSRGKVKISEKIFWACLKAEKAAGMQNYLHSGGMRVIDLLNRIYSRRPVPQTGTSIRFLPK